MRTDVPGTAGNEYGHQPIPSQKSFRSFSCSKPNSERVITKSSFVARNLRDRMWVRFQSNFIERGGSSRINRNRSNLLITKSLVSVMVTMEAERGLLSMRVISP